MKREVASSGTCMYTKWNVQSYDITNGQVHGQYFPINGPKYVLIVTRTNADVQFIPKPKNSFLATEAGNLEDSIC